MSESANRTRPTKGGERRVDDESRESFPASDPPSWSAGTGGVPTSDPAGSGGGPTYPPGMDPRQRLAHSSSMLDADTRRRVFESLSQRVWDGVDLHSQIKVAHWNVKGPHFVALHALFDELATAVQAHTDLLAERAVTLGARIDATVRQAAAHSRLPEYPAEARQGIEHVRALADRIETYIDGATEALRLIDEVGDRASADALSSVLASLEKYGWMLRATLDSDGATAGR